MSSGRYFLENMQLRNKKNIYFLGKGKEKNDRFFLHRRFGKMSNKIN
jgi:hypothetical protein